MTLYNKKEIKNGYNRFLKENDYSVSTIKNYTSITSSFLNFIEGEFFSEEEIDEIYSNYVLYLKDEKNISENTVKTNITVCNIFIRYITGNSSHNRKIPKVPKRLPDALSLEEAHNLVNTPYLKFRENGGEINRLILRDKLVIIFILSTGVRVSELVNVQLEDIDFSSRTIVICGKGNKERVILFNEDCANLLKLVIDVWEIEDYIFLNMNDKKITTRSIQNIVGKYSELSLGKHISPHKLRHTFATNLLESKVDTRYIQDLLGHESLETTQIYTKVKKSKIKSLYDKVIFY